jgi:hypothetical protein
MSSSVSRWLAPAALSVAVVGAAFQPIFCSANPLDPLDPKAKVPALVYESSLARYRPYGEAKPIGWREANDTVNRIGGWRAYAREAQQADAPTEQAPRAQPAKEAAKLPAAPGHGGHKPQ